MSVALHHWEPNANSGKPMLAFDQHEPEYPAINPQGTIRRDHGICQRGLPRASVTHPERIWAPGPEINRWG